MTLFRRLPHYSRTVAATVTLMAICLAGCGQEKPRSAKKKPPSGDAVVKREYTWLTMGEKDGPVERADHVAFVINQEMLVWGGVGQTGDLLTDGAIYDLKGGKWTSAIPETPFSPRHGYVAGAAGGRLLIWGGQSAGTDGDPKVLGSGSVFDPIDFRWIPVSRTGAPSPRYQAAAVSDGGKRVYIWGGKGPDSLLNDGASYDIESDTWEPLPTIGAPSARAGHAMVWAEGHGIWVFGGMDDTPLADGAGFREGMWMPFPDDHAPSARTEASAVNIGNWIVVYGGKGSRKDGILGSSGLFDLTTWEWKKMDQPESVFDARLGSTASVVGTKMLIMGGHNETTAKTAGFFDTEGGVWRALNVPLERTRHTAVTFENSVFVFGGRTATGKALAAGRQVRFN